MSYLEKLLEGVVVEWKSLGNVCKVLRGKRLTKKELLKNGKFPVFHGGLIPLGLYDKYNRKANQTMIINTGSVGEVVWSGVDFWSSDGTFVVETNESIDNKFLYHFLKTQEQYFKTQKREGGVPTIDRTVVESLLIPIPPLSVQKEIARILDAFTELTSELTSELIARKKQYDYYRDTLLSFNEGEIEWKTLEVVCSSISAGGDLPVNFKKGQEVPTDEFPYPIYANATSENGLYGFTNEYKIESDAVTISARGAKIGYHAVREGKFTPIIRLITLVPNKSKVLTRYLNYILDMTPIGGSDGGIPQLTVPTVKKLSIPVPSLEEQAHIISILDKFDTLTNSISEGLPKEIALRKKQYEYYRELLLTFPKDK